MIKERSSASAPLRIVIIGAGVAGSLMARRLSRLSPVELTVLERSEAGDHEAAGTGLNIGPNAVKALRAFDAALADRLMQEGLPWRSLRKSLVDGRILSHLVLDRVADCDGLRLRWSELYRVLREGCGDAIRYGCAVTDVGPDRVGSPRTAVSWTDRAGSHRLEGIDLLVGADGRYSRTRHRFSGPPAVRQLGVVIFRLLVRDTSAGLIDDHEQWFNGPNRLLAFKVKPDHVYIAGAFPIAPGHDIGDDAKEPGILREAYTPASGTVSAPVRWIIDTICRFAPDAHWARMQDHALLFTEPELDVLYVGDAAHGMVPTLGQGATQAIEDGCFAAARIARAVAAGQCEPRGWIEAIAAERTPRVQFVTDLSRSASEAMLAGGNPERSFAHEGEAGSLALLRRLFRDIPPIGDRTES